jgi:multidrug efflux pump subunit AcrB
MQKLAEICIRRPVFAAMIVLSLVVVGAASYFRLGVDRFPSVDLPTVSVRTSLPGASSEEVETLVSQPRHTSHAGVPAAERKRLGIPDGFVRVSVGVEDVADLIEDFEAALEGS